MNLLSIPKQIGLVVIFTMLLQLRLKMTLALAMAQIQKEHLDLDNGIPLEVVEYSQEGARQLRESVNIELLKRGLTDQ